VCDESVEGIKQWFRGRLVARPKNPEEETFDVYYVDDGRQRKTHISNIYRLEANNRALATFPPQALPVRLHDVPEIAGQMLGRLRGLMPPRSEALVGVIQFSKDCLICTTFLTAQGCGQGWCEALGQRLHPRPGSGVNVHVREYRPSSGVRDGKVSVLMLAPMHCQFILYHYGPCHAITSPSSSFTNDI